METRPLYVGIDLGTTNSAAAVFDGKDLTLIRNRQGGVLTPSVVRIDARGNVTVGARARRFLDTDPPKDGTVTLDFNEAYNPPCAYNPNTTCPLPPPANRLRVRIEAGEKTYHREH